MIHLYIRTFSSDDGLQSWRISWALLGMRQIVSSVMFGVVDHALLVASSDEADDISRSKKVDNFMS